jgi:hypothetical protein
MLNFARGASGLFFLVAVATLSTAANAAPVGRLCNADGRVEVLSQASEIACGTTAKDEARALLRARQRYESDWSLGFDTKALISARIERRLSELRKEQRQNKLAQREG